MIVKSCSKIESGLRFGPEGIRPCQLGPFSGPLYWTDEQANTLKVTKKDIIKKRKELFDQLNDDFTDIICKKCSMVHLKDISDVNFGKLGRIDHSPDTMCNLRCDFCGFTHAENIGDIKNSFKKSTYDSLKFLKCFENEDINWDSEVDFNGGEPSLLKDLDKYMNFFREKKIRVLCFTNAVTFNEYIYKALIDGTIKWLVTSIDAGTSLTYKLTKKSSAYFKVLENCSRYSYAGSQNGGNFAVKYIFTNNNCNDDDIYGFAYAMLAIRPQKIWLTFDFAPFSDINPDADNFGNYNFDKQIEAYAKLYNLLKKHGITAIHYTEGHLAKISRPGKILLDLVKRKCDELSYKDKYKELNGSLLLKNFREQNVYINNNIKKFKLFDKNIIVEENIIDLINNKILNNNYFIYQQFIIFYLYIKIFDIYYLI